MIWNKKSTNQVRAEQQVPPRNLVLPKTSMPSNFSGGKGVDASLATQEQTFKLSLQQSIDPLNPAQTKVWTYNIPVLGANQRSLILQILGGELFILNIPSTDFPQQIYLYADGVNGYNNNGADPTNIVAIFRVRQLVPCVVGSMVTYTIIYSCMDTSIWNLGTQRTLSFHIGDDNGVYECPLAQRVQVQLKIIHVSY